MTEPSTDGESGVAGSVIGPASLGGLHVVRATVMPSTRVDEPATTFKIDLLKVSEKHAILVGDIERKEREFVIAATVYGRIDGINVPTDAADRMNMLEQLAAAHRHSLYDFGAAIMRVLASFVSPVVLTVPVGTPDYTALPRDDQ